MNASHVIKKKEAEATNRAPQGRALSAKIARKSASGSRMGGADILGLRQIGHDSTHTNNRGGTGKRHKNMKAKTILTLAACLVLAGCAGPPAQSTAEGPTQEEIANAIYPPKPDYRKEALIYFHNTLKDPASAVYDNWTLQHAWIATPPAGFGWIVHVSVNAKNSYGGYTGAEDYFLWVKSLGGVIDLQMPRAPHTVMLDTVEMVMDDGSVVNVESKK